MGREHWRKPAGGMMRKLILGALIGFALALHLSAEDPPAPPSMAAQEMPRATAPPPPRLR